MRLRRPLRNLKLAQSSRIARFAWSLSPPDAHAANCSEQSVATLAHPQSAGRSCIEAPNRDRDAVDSLCCASQAGAQQPVRFIDRGHAIAGQLLFASPAVGQASSRRTLPMRAFESRYIMGSLLLSNPLPPASALAACARRSTTRPRESLLPPISSTPRPLRRRRGERSVPKPAIAFIPARRFSQQRERRSCG